ncbi:MAG: aminotransferase class V-fold PLP-dependent enzyme [Gammaproteobacteria bacterium]|nr:aminotransferase class V-fold PLP-dependent enzyme [Gammaproteobacteria bacterium]
MQFKNAKVYLVPGPIQIPKQIQKIYQQNLGSADTEPEFIQLYRDTEKSWQKILGTKNNLVIMTGEAMLGLWSGLKSCLKPGDKVLAIANGMFSDDIGIMASLLGAKVKFLKFPYHAAVEDFAIIEKTIKEFKPKMLTAVHCETPSGILNPIAAIGALKHKYRVPLFYVDAVSSIGGSEVRVDDWHIDICLGGGQKAPSIYPDMTFITVSNAAWDIIKKVKYVGYDALLPFYRAPEKKAFPYTPHWHGVLALNQAALMLLDEGLQKVYLRHERCAEFCRNSLLNLGFELFPEKIIDAASTVSAFKVPKRISWEKFDSILRRHGLIVGGSYEKLAGKVFRIGHMGQQANIKLIAAGVSIIKQSCKHIIY